MAEEKKNETTEETAGAPAEETAAEATPAEETPVEATPAAETPVEATPAAETPVEETPAAEAPAEESAAEETPVEATPVEETPAAEAPAEEPAAEADAPAEEAPAAEPAAAAQAPAEPAAPQAQSEPKKKGKRLPRRLRLKKTRVQRVAASERKPISREPKPEHDRGRHQERRGVVVSDAMDKTIVVKVDTIRQHPRYKKVIRRSIKFHAHDEQNTAKVGDVVRIVETRPLSKTKHWRLAEIVEVAK
jgi:small subunit ribosomal protein S17